MKVLMRILSRVKYYHPLMEYIENIKRLDKLRPNQGLKPMRFHRITANCYIIFHNKIYLDVPKPPQPVNNML